MQTKPLSLVLAALAAAVAADHAEHFHIGDYWGDDYYDGSLPGVVNDIPACALPCLTAKAAAWGCQPTDFHCLCNHGVGIAAEVALCLPNACSTITSSAALSELCIRWALGPPSTEVAAATSTMGARLASASGSAGGSATAPAATATGVAAAVSTPSSTGSPPRQNAAPRKESALGLLGLAAVVGLIF